MDRGRQQNNNNTVGQNEEDKRIVDQWRSAEGQVAVEVAIDLFGVFIIAPAMDRCQWRRTATETRKSCPINRSPSDCRY
ncbi:hypothetical protein GWI33_005363 [Rhynchophorus ferrugineus]|uniref:Uncharacterized protein n=1 Tax=Rhynchophorus ferrugineus TaxID=354439 RepID=A0A834IU44_RHYFE|nr:hypothetical protein GWI33_005363 [Rhynchophorus ferrugineus]